MRRPGSRLFAIHQLAEHLHKSAAEIRRLPVAELDDWQAYFAVCAERKKSGKG